VNAADRQHLTRLAQRHLEALGDAAADLGLRLELQQDSLDPMALARVAAEAEALCGQLEALRDWLPAPLPAEADPCAAP
jgi:hypothetical protein